jgi:Peptidase family M28
MLVIGQWQPDWRQGSLSFLASQPSPEQATAQEAPVPLVGSERLLADLKALSFTRYDEAERQSARDYIVQSLEAAGWTVQRQPFAQLEKRTAGIERGVNLFAERLGTDPNAGAILLGAHYDTVAQSPGADDNATAVATVLEAARLLGQLPTARSLQLALFDLEERGLYGSQAFVEQLAQPEMLQGAVILDMVGYACEMAGCQTYPALLPMRPPTDRGTFLAALGDQSHAFLLDSFTQPDPAQPPVITLPIPTVGGVAADLVRSDHAPFWQRGIGAVLVTDTANFRNPHYHQPSDTLDTINPDFFVSSAQIVVRAVTYLLKPLGNSQLQSQALTCCF